MDNDRSDQTQAAGGTGPESNYAPRILYQARSELYLNIGFLDLSLSSLGFEADWSPGRVATDGWLIYYGTEYLAGLLRREETELNRAYLHMLFHCLLCITRKDRDKEYWDLACDIAMESVIDGLYQNVSMCPKKPPAGRPTAPGNRPGMAQDDRAGRARWSGDRPYRRIMQTARFPLTAGNGSTGRLRKWTSGTQAPASESEFFVDSHDLWEQEDDPRQARPRQNQWNDNREKVQTQMETKGSKEESEDNRSLLDQVQVENRERYDYSQFLRKFAVMREEMQVDPDSL